MNQTQGQKVSMLAINLIEDQLRALPITIAAVLQVVEVGNVEADLLSHLVLKRKPRPAKTGSAGNIVADKADTNPAVDFQTSSQNLQNNPFGKNQYLRVIVSNSLLSVSIFWKQHGIASIRTPEIQFLGHVVDAILNANTFKIEPGYMPTASFDGLVIDSSLNGTPLFGDNDNEGFMEYGDAIALLQWLSRYLRGMHKFVSGGDAG